MPTPESLALPQEIEDHLRGSTLSQVTIGLSGSDVYRLLAVGQPARYLKVGRGYAARELAAERDRLEWLRGRLSVPRVLAFTREGERAALLLSEVPGLMACDPAFADDIPALIGLYADALRQVHQLDHSACPFSACPCDVRLDRRLVEAGQRTRAGLIKVEAFDASRQGIAPTVLYERLLRERPANEELVFTHGDYCLPNVLIDHERNCVSGYIDWSRAGVADRYTDLALAARSLAYNFGPGYEPLFWDAYGLEEVDAAKVTYYQLLDEFF